MQEEEYIFLSKHLQDIADKMPNSWATVQNNRHDYAVNVFNYNSLESLTDAIKHFSQDDRNYFLRRWFLWTCSRCDEYLFYRQDGIAQNPDYKGRDWDIEFFGRSELRFDIKSTVLPKEMRTKDLKLIPDNHLELIKFNYDRQSRGVRMSMQNRLFIVHIFTEPDIENKLRTCFDSKEVIYTKYTDTIRRNPYHKFFEYSNAISDIIYIADSGSGFVEYRFASEDLNKYKK